MVKLHVLVNLKSISGYYHEILKMRHSSMLYDSEGINRLCKNFLINASYSASFPAKEK
jgi:hypothetical protein